MAAEFLGAPASKQVGACFTQPSATQAEPDDQWLADLLQAGVMQGDAVEVIPRLGMGAVELFFTARRTLLSARTAALTQTGTSSGSSHPPKRCARPRPRPAASCSTSKTGLRRAPSPAVGIVCGRDCEYG